MARIFWVTCTKCKRKFYAATADFKDTDRHMKCPFCGTKFTEAEAMKADNTVSDVSN